MPTTPRLQPRLAHMGLPLRLLLGLATLILLGHSLREFMTRASDVSFCAMTYMWPAFELISEVPSTGVQALDAKYRLYLYREMDGRHADESRFKRLPLLFVHGNAGSYKQARSLGAELHRMALDNPVDVYFDVFTALHAPTLHDQAVYLSFVIQYLKARYRLTEFPIVAHSMGGIATKKALILDSQRLESTPNGTSWTLMTIATPHSDPPIPLSHALMSFYKKLQQDWDNKMSSSSVIVSFAGGSLDTTLNSELCRVPPSLGITLYTFEIDTVWTGADHRALLWCNQFVKKLTGFVMDSILKNSSTTSSEKLETISRYFSSQKQESALTMGGPVAFPKSLVVPLTSSYTQSKSVNENYNVLSIELKNGSLNESHGYLQVYSTQAANQLKIFGCDAQQTCQELILDLKSVPRHMISPSVSWTTHSWISQPLESLKLMGKEFNQILIDTSVLAEDSVIHYSHSLKECSLDLEMSFFDLLKPTKKAFKLKCPINFIINRLTQDSLAEYYAKFELENEQGDSTTNGRLVVQQSSSHPKYIPTGNWISLSFLSDASSDGFRVWTLIESELYVQLQFRLFATMGKLIVYRPGFWIGILLLIGMLQNGAVSKVTLRGARTSMTQNIFHLVLAILVFETFIQTWIRPWWSSNLFLGHHSSVFTLIAVVLVIFCCVILESIIRLILAVTGPRIVKSIMSRLVVFLDIAIPIVIGILHFTYNLPSGLAIPFLFLRHLICPRVKKSRDAAPSFLVYLLFIMSIFDGAALVVTIQNNLFGFSSSDVSFFWYSPILLLGPLTTYFGCHLSRETLFHKYLLYASGWLCLAFGWKHTYVIYHVAYWIVVGQCLQTLLEQRDGVRRIPLTQLSSAKRD